MRAIWKFLGWKAFIQKGESHVVGLAPSRQQIHRLQRDRLAADQQLLSQRRRPTIRPIDRVGRCWEVGLGSTCHPFRVGAKFYRGWMYLR